MSLLQNPQLRAIFRRTGAKRVYYRTLSLLSSRSDYEQKFSESLLNSIRSGDCVWDVGANVGHYTEKFAERVGSSGIVIAIEPFHATFLELASRMERYRQVRCVAVALGSENKTLRVEPVAALSTGNSIAAISDSPVAEEILVRTGANLIEEGVPQPSILKIDVEGFEEEVLWGLRDALRSPDCRGIFVEVHYGALAQRQCPRAPSRLVSTLRDLGYRTRWLDRSHLAGFRLQQTIR